MKKVLILLVLLILAAFVFAGDDDDNLNQEDSILTPITGEITIDLSPDKFHIIKNTKDWKIKDKIFVGSQPCFIFGRAQDMISKENLPLRKMNTKNKEVNSICLSSLKIVHLFLSGEITFCCGAFITNHTLIKGNIRNEEFETILTKGVCSPIYNLLSVKGFSEIVEFLIANGCELPEEYSSMCHLCHLLFTDERYSKMLSNYLNKNSLKYLLEREIVESRETEEINI